MTVKLPGAIYLLGMAVISSIFMFGSGDAIATDEFEKTLVSIFDQIKLVTKEKSTPERIEGWIKEAINRGANSLKIDHYANGDMGWSAISHEGKEVFAAIFSFSNGKVKEGTYFGPLAAAHELARNFHAMHIDILSKHFSPISSTEYDLGDQCIARVSLFLGSTGLGRTTAKINCR